MLHQPWREQRQSTDGQDVNDAEIGSAAEQQLPDEYSTKAGREEKAKGGQIFLQLGDGKRTAQTASNQRHLQEFPRFEQETVGALFPLSGCHVGRRPGPPTGRQRVPIPVSEAPLELFGSREEESQPAQ